MRLDRDLGIGVAALAFAGVYRYLSLEIQESLLADAVGPQGLPSLYAAALAVLGICLIGQALLRRRRPGAAMPDATGGAVPGWGRHLRAAGLLAFGAAYLLLIGFAGYALTIFLLIVGVALYVGAWPGARLLAIAALGAALLWVIFAQLFQLGLPAGSLWPRLLS